MFFEAYIYFVRKIIFILNGSMGKSISLISSKFNLEIIIIIYMLHNKQIVQRRRVKEINETKELARVEFLD